MARKPAHKIAGREVKSAELSRVTDTVGRVVRDRLAFASFSAAEQAAINRAEEGSGGTGRSKREVNGS